MKTDTRTRSSFKLTISVKVIVIIVLIGLFAGGIIIAILANQSLISKPTELDFYADAEYVFTGTGFMYKIGSTLQYEDLNDKESYSGDLPYSDMKLSGYGHNTHAVYNENTLCIIGLDNAVTPEGTIKSVKCGNGYIACLIQSGDADKICVYNTKGKMVQEISPEYTIMLFGFTHLDTEQVYTVEVNTNAETYISTISTFDPSMPAKTGIITVQNQLIENILFTKKSVFVEGTTNIIRYDAEDNSESYRLITRGYCAYDSYVKGNTVYFLMKNDSEDKSSGSVRIYTASQSKVPSEKVTPIQIPSDTLEVFLHDGNVYAITPSAIHMYDSEGTLIDSETPQFNITEAHSLGDGNLLIISGTKLYACTVTGTNSIKKLFN